MGVDYHYYLVRIQFLGFRYSGWQKQPGQKTVEGMLLKTLKFVLPGRKLKVLGSGRTDAKVSALDAAFELFLEGVPISGEKAFFDLLNLHLPPDIKAIEIRKINKDFNIIQNAKLKEYIYLFSFGGKNHPFCAPFMANIQEELDIALMKTGARLFEGEHNFSSYTAKKKENKEKKRQIISCEIVENKILRANFFPEKSYALHISSRGFMRYQVRMIMGALVQLGLGELKLADVKASLSPGNEVNLTYVAPGSGLLLNKLEFE
ncbi:MAG: tRNA pseudouridine synthase A [Aurantibacter sp.]